MLKVIDFKVDFQKNPLVASFEPLFAWRAEGAGEPLYSEVAVASAADKLDAPDVWKSGRLAGRAASVPYGGEPLKSGTAYCARVTLVSAGGESRADGVFETGLRPGDFYGKWIGLPVNFQGGALYFRRNVNVPQGKTVKRARAYVCGLGCHELYVNGDKAGDAVLAPSVTDYGKRVEYCVYDITGRLKPGENALGVIVGHGWLGERKLLAQINITFSDGSQACEVTLNGVWWVTGSPVKDNSIYGGEVYDARREDDFGAGWCSPDYRTAWDTGWMMSVLVGPPIGFLTPMLIEPIRVTAEYKPVSKTARGGLIVFDIGRNIAGWAKIRVRGARGAKVSLTFAERLGADGFPDRSNLRTAQSRDLYILRGGGGDEVWQPRFTYHGFQYVQVKTEGGAELLELTACHVHTDVMPCGSFSCSDADLNKLHEIAVRTERNNLHGIMTDCPQRDERFGWLNDLSARLFQTVYNFNMGRFFDKFVTDISDTQDETGAIADTAPYYVCCRPADPVCVSYLIIPLESYKRYGDARPILREYQNLRAWTDYLLTRAENYIMTYTYYNDWVAPACYTDAVTDGLFVSSVYLYWHLKLTSEIAVIAGNAADAEKYAKHAEGCRSAVNNKYYDAGKKNYSYGTQSENSMALWLGIAPDRDRAAIAKNVADDIIKRGGHSSCGNQGYRHMFYAMTEAGYIDELVKMMKNPEYPGWGYMLANGATSVWERWEKEMQVVMHSFNHPMFGSYDAWFYKYLGGIGLAADSAGADKIEIKPYIPAGIGRVDCHVDTVRGRIVCNWEKPAADASDKSAGKESAGTVTYKITVPPLTTAQISLQGTVVSAARISGPAAYSGGRAVFRAGAGDYVIVMKAK